MKKYIFLALIPALLASCSSRTLIVKRSPANESPRMTQKSPPPASNGEPAAAKSTQPEVKTGGTVNNSATAYIERFKVIAISEMNEYGIPASITLAQGLLESANGNSTLAREANNHFGIKCTSEWQGKTILRDDDEKDECFRVYKSPEESFRDHSEFLKRKRYAALFELDKNDYRGWANGLREAGYATNPRYAELLVSLIERYQLDHYDVKENSVEKSRREDRIMEDIARDAPQEKKTELAKAPVAMKIYEVKDGDTLFSLGKRFGLTVDELKMLNNIQGTDLKQGQLLLVSR